MTSKSFGLVVWRLIESVRGPGSILDMALFDFFFIGLYLCKKEIKKIEKKKIKGDADVGHLRRQIGY